MVDRRARERRAGRRAVEGRAPTALHENSATCSRLNSPAPCRDAWGRRRSQQARASTIFRTPQARRPHTELHRRDLSSAILAALRSGQPTLQLVEQFVPCRAGLHTATPGAARLARTMRGIPQYEFRSSGRVSAATEHANYAFRASTAICRSCASRLLLTYMTPNMRRGDAGSRRLQHRRRLAPLLQSLGLWCALTGA